MTAPVFDRYLSEVEERQLLRTMREIKGDFARRDRSLILLMRTTGLRVGSAVGLDIDDAEEALATSSVRVRADIAKGGEAYTVHLGRHARSALLDLVRLRRGMRSAPGHEDALIVSRLGFRLSVRSVQDRMAQWVTRAGLSTRATPHWLRHTFAKRIVQNSTSRDPHSVVAAALGHTSTRNTWIYLKPDKESVSRAVEAAQ